MANYISYTKEQSAEIDECSIKLILDQKVGSRIVESRNFQKWFKQVNGQDAIEVLYKDIYTSYIKYGLAVYYGNDHKKPSEMNKCVICFKPEKGLETFFKLKFI